MKNLLLILFVITLTSCSVSLDKIKSTPENWTIEPVIVLNWDKSYPVDRWIYVLELDKPDTSINNVPFVLREKISFKGDSLIKVYVLESSFTETYELLDGNPYGNPKQRE